jgi:hypothetical protein
MHGDLAAAARYNRAIYVVAPLGIWIWATYLRVLYVGAHKAAAPPSAAPPTDAS